MLSSNEIMQLVFDDLRSNRPKPLKSCYFHCLPVHKRFISLPNMAELTNYAVEWKSTTEITLPVVDDLRENLPNPSKSCELHSLLEHRRCVSLPNLGLRTISTSKASEIGSKSTPNVMLPAVDDLRENVKKPSENCYVQCLPAHKRSLSLPDVALRANPAGDASEVGVPSVTSAELPVSNDSPCAETCMPCMVTSMPPASTSEDIGIETPLSVSSSSALVLKVEEVGVRHMVTDPVTHDGRSDEETDPAASCTATLRRPRQSLWSRTKKIVRRMFCCVASFAGCKGVQMHPMNFFNKLFAKLGSQKVINF
ncbi:hypothetical protein QTP88_017816 [Uroleucon formosanum]